MEFQPGDLVRPRNSPPGVGNWDIALVVGFAREIPGGYPVPEGKRPIIEVLGGKLHGTRIERWASSFEKVEK
ncbi:MAG: hypothetical protein QF412_04500 [Planctomycetota bacterium]|nr:hypothetical protein [Planctomycetota bacterium]